MQVGGSQGPGGRVEFISHSLLLQMLRNCLRQLTPEEGEGGEEREGEEEGTAGSEGEGVWCI